MVYKKGGKMMNNSLEIKNKEELFTKVVNAIDAFWYGNVKEEKLLVNSSVPVTFNLKDGIVKVQIIDEENV